MYKVTITTKERGTGTIVSETTLNTMALVSLMGAIAGMPAFADLTADEQQENLFKNGEWHLCTIPQRSIIYVGLEGTNEEQQEAPEQQEASELPYEVKQMENLSIIARPGAAFDVFIKFSSESDPGLPTALAMVLSKSIVYDSRLVSTKQYFPYFGLGNVHVIVT